MDTKIEIKLTETDVNDGRIIDAGLKFLTKDSKATIICDGIEYPDINHSNYYGYFTGLKELHKAHHAIIGTKVIVTRIGDNIFDLKYEDNNGTKTSASSNVAVENNQRQEPKVCFSVTDTKPIDYSDKEKGLTQLIDDIKSLLVKYPYSFYRNETTVRSEIIDPILRELGWKIPYIENEALCRNGGNVDYALRKGLDYYFVIEAKSLYKDIDNSECRKQINRYMGDSRFAGIIGIVTNGYQWICYLPNNEKIIKTNIADNNFISFIKLLDFETFDAEAFRQINFESVEGYNITKGFDVIYADGSNWKSIRGNKNVADTFVAFVSNHKEIIADNKELYRQEVISNKHFRVESNTKINNVSYHITRDYETYMKRMLIQQIIDLFEIPAKIVDQE